MTVDIDTRLREAGASLQRASFGLTPPEPRRRRPVALAVAVAAAVVVLVAGAAAVLRDDEDASTDISTDPGGIPALAPEVVPPGLVRVGAADLPATLGGPAPVSVTAYGDPGAADPFATADLGIVVSDSPIDAPGDPVTVRGAEGRLTTLLTGGTSLTWEEAGVTIGLGSYSLTRTQLLEVADALTVDGSSVTFGPDAAPPGVTGTFAPVGEIADLSVALLPVREAAPGHVVSYQAEGGGASLVAATVAGDRDDLAVLRWASGAVTPVDVHGHEGWIGGAGPAQELGESLTAVWEEAPGVLATVRGFGVSEADLLAAAESLRPLPVAEWRSALDEAMGSPVPSDAQVTLEGQYAEGTWAVYVTADDQLCGATESGTEGSETCGQGDGLSVTTLHDNAGEAVLAYGEMPVGATGVRSRAADGTESDEGASVATDGDRSVWAVVVDPSAMPIGFAFVDGAGAEVAFLPLDR